MRHPPAVSPFRSMRSPSIVRSSTRPVCCVHEEGSPRCTYLVPDSAGNVLSPILTFGVVSPVVPFALGGACLNIDYIEHSPDNNLTVASACRAHYLGMRLDR